MNSRKQILKPEDLVCYKATYQVSKTSVNLASHELEPVYKHETDATNGSQIMVITVFKMAKP